MTDKRVSLAVALVTLLVVVLTGVMWFDRNRTAEISQNLQHFPSNPTSKWHRQYESEDKPTGLSASESSQHAWYRRQVVVLTYHHIADDRTKPYAISPALFAQHMKFLYEHHLHPITLQEFLHFVDTGELATDNAVLITFDDGYESVYTQAYPVLKRYSFPAVAFVIAGRVRDSIERKSPNMIPPLTRVELKDMLASGIVEIGSHTYSLHDQTALQEWGDVQPDTPPVYREEVGRLETDEAYRDRLFVDFSMSRAVLSDYFGKQVNAISFPYGVTNSAVVETARDAGYRYAFTSTPGVVKPGVDPFAIPRFGVGRPDVGVQQLEQLFTSVKTTR